MPVAAATENYIRQYAHTCHGNYEEKVVQEELRLGVFVKRHFGAYLIRFRTVYGENMAKKEGYFCPRCSKLEGKKTALKCIFPGVHRCPKCRKEFLLAGGLFFG
jgi:ribosomal protein L37AE/L43A